MGSIVHRTQLEALRRSAACHDSFPADLATDLIVTCEQLYADLHRARHHLQAAHRELGELRPLVTELRGRLSSLSRHLRE